MKLQHPYTKESFDTLIEFYEDRNKPDQTTQWQAKLSQQEEAVKQ